MKKSNKKELRSYDSTLTYRSDSEKESGNVVEGYAAVYNSESEEMWGFREIIAPGAFDEADTSDTRALFNHDPNFLLARTSSGTLELSTDENGLKYRFTLPDTTAGRDLREMLKRGDVSQSSFGFTVAEDEWTERTEEGEVVEVIRTIKKVERLFDVSPVTYPAYTAASVTLRSLEQFQKRNKQEPEENTGPEDKPATPLLDEALALIETDLIIDDLIKNSQG